MKRLGWFATNEGAGIGVFFVDKLRRLRTRWLTNTFGTLCRVTDYDQMTSRQWRWRRNIHIEKRGDNVVEWCSTKLLGINQKVQWWHAVLCHAFVAITDAHLDRLYLPVNINVGTHWAPHLYRLTMLREPLANATKKRPLKSQRENDIHIYWRYSIVTLTCNTEFLVNHSLSMRL